MRPNISEKANKHHKALTEQAGLRHAALKKQNSELTQQIQVMTEDMSMSSGNANGEVSEEQQRIAGDAVASAAAFDLM